MAAVFAMQGVGALLSVLIVMLCLGSGLSTDYSWRIALAFGAMPVVIAFPWRLRMHETESFEHLQQVRSDVSSMTPYGSEANLAGSAASGNGYGQIPDSSSHGADPQGGAMAESLSKVNHTNGPVASENNFSRMSEIKHAFAG